MLGSRRCLALLLIAIGASCVACSSKPINPGTGQIDVFVWRVFADSGDSPGSYYNVGCRLSDAEITDIVNQLISNASVYGNNTSIVWDGNVQDMVNGYHLGTRTTDSGWLQEWIDASPAARWRDGKINIYFTGNYTTSGGLIWGQTWDPPQHSPAFGTRKLILINDGGFPSLPYGLKAPMQIIDFRILEHEFEHYLGRFQNRSFGPPNARRAYDASEHTSDPNNLLRSGGAPPAFPLVIPGSSGDHSTEKGEIWERIDAGLWNSAANP